MYGLKKNTKTMLASLSLTATMILGAFGAPSHEAKAAESKPFLVLFKSESSLPADYEKLITDAGGSIKKAIGKMGAVQVTSANPDFESQIERSSAVLEAGVENTIMPDAPVFEQELDATLATGDLYQALQWDIKQVTKNGASWSLPGGTGKSVDGKDIVVAVVDTGIDYNHPDLKANYAYGKSFVPGFPDAMDQNGHGTHVAGSIAAKGRTMGIGPDLKVAAYRVFGPTGGAATADIANALMTAADDNVDVVNMSLGGYDWFQNPDYATKDTVEDVRLFNRAIQYAIKKGVTVVGSAGNNGVDISSPGKLSGDDNGATHRSPSSQTLIRVSAGGEAKNLAFYSNYGVGKIDVMAPGGDYGLKYAETRNPLDADRTKLCLATVPGGGYGYKAGTSMAAPKVAALAGVIIAQHGKDVLSPSQVKHILQSSSDDVFKTGYDGESGFGLVNAVNALQ
ncbi:S8 family serine peptidase [Fictibacillus iocasae]|uniref:S8 family serine peptidase n=1 Tax=Fictibacillus iocasae TaxID=2715437 RepID=A0ABW2NQN9_9BACL